MPLTFKDVVFTPYRHGIHNDPDGTLARVFIDETCALLARRGVEVTPNIVLRLSEIVSLTLIARQIEAALACEHAIVTPPGESGPTGRSSTHPFVETLAKTQERLRKAIKEFEEASVKIGASIETGLADELRPLLLQTTGVLEDALSHGK